MKTNSSLYLSTHFEGHWEWVVRPWFEEKSKTSWLQTKPTVVLIPSQSFGFFLKSRLLEMNSGFFRIFFWTPEEYWSWLIKQFENVPRLADPEDLRLVLSVIAEQYLKSFPQATQIPPMIQSIATDPSDLIESLGLLSQSGYDFDVIENETLKPILKSFSNILTQSKLSIIRGINHEITQVIDSLLWVGFDGRHWPYWNLLRTVTQTSASSMICLQQPRYQAEKVDQLWISSWEEWSGTVATILESPVVWERPFTSLASRMELDDEIKSEKKRAVVYYIGKNIREQAKAIAMQATVFLSENEPSRIGILFPRSNALSREVAVWLNEWQIPHHDALGHNGFASLDPNEQMWKNGWLFKANRD